MLKIIIFVFTCYMLLTLLITSIATLLDNKQLLKISVVLMCGVPIVCIATIVLILIC